MGKYTVLVVDDEPDIHTILTEPLENAGYRVVNANNGAAALGILERETPDVILSDNRMPRMTGIEFFEVVRKHYQNPIRILMTGFADLSIAIEAINRGWVYKFITKPFKIEEILVTFRRALEYYEILKQKQILEQQLREQNALLEQRVHERTKELRELTQELSQKNVKLLQQKNKIRKLFTQLQRSYLGTITALYFALEARDPYTRGHSERVFYYALNVGKRMSLDSEEILHLKYAAILHDLGKIGIPDSILRKRGELTEEEFAAIKDHPMIGSSILDPIQFLSKAKTIIRHHHERYDGLGYPDGIANEMIDIQGRIIAVADAYDAMRSDRPYRGSLSREEALRELRGLAGSQFCPRCVEAFQKVLVEMGDFYEEPKLMQIYQDELKFMESDLHGLGDVFALRSMENLVAQELSQPI